MMFLLGFLSVVLVLDCVLLILLVLIQLPKKEAGAALAFGGSTTDALFGAGTGNVLTKTTKFATIAFFVLLLVIGIIQTSVFSRSSNKFIQNLENASKAPAAPVTPPPTTVPAATSNVLSTSSLTNLQSLTLTNAVK